MVEQPQENPYLQEVWKVLPRLLSQYDMDPYSPTLGQGDRYRWAWKLKDFGSAVPQGAASGLARLTVAELLPGWLTEAVIIEHIQRMFTGVQRLTYPDGSLEEAFPYEGSFCVTAQVAFDLLDAMELLGDRLDRESCLSVIAPLIGFLRSSREEHGVITNHLASGAAALLKWHQLTGGDAKVEGEKFLKTILATCSDEGWFPEYQGADPGYQTLAMQYLAVVHEFDPRPELDAALRKGVEFLSYFVHPDGSYGGGYGSRNTRVFYPGGLEALVASYPLARAICQEMRRSIETLGTVVLGAMDDSALVPLFNSYCRAAACLERANRGENPEVILPCHRPERFRRIFSDAGLFVEGGNGSYLVVSLHKGGALLRNDAFGRHADCGRVYRDLRGRLFSAQGYDSEAEVIIGADRIIIESRLQPLLHRLPTPIEFLVLRCLNLTVMRIPAVSRWIKRLLVRMLITGGKSQSVRNRRTIVLYDSFQVEDVLSGPGADQFLLEDRSGTFRMMHMAMSGFWQRGDE